jgi:AraC family transcriptional activator of pobA
MRNELLEPARLRKSATTTCRDGLEVHDLQELMNQMSARNNLSFQPDTFLMIWLINNPTIYCMYAPQVKFLGEGFCVKGYALSFTSEFICSLKSEIGILYHSGLFNIYQERPLPISLDNTFEMEQLIQSMIQEYKSTTELRTEMMRSLLKIMIIKLSRRMRTHCLPESNMKNEIRVFKDFQALIFKNFLTMKKVSDYADALGMAPNYLNTIVRKVSGFTARHHIQQQIVVEAKRQATWEGISLKEIGYRLGFENPSHFSKFFKKTSGSSFSAFKRDCSATFR